jgi:hypothetical protein
MRSRVLLELGNPQGRDTQIDQAINDAIIEIIQTFHPSEVTTTATASTVNTTNSYSFSTDFSATDVLAILGVRNNTDDYRLKRGSYLEFMTHSKDTTTGAFGRPNKWARQGNNLILYSLIPGAVYTIEMYYLQRPAELTADADTFPLNREWERPTVLLASSYAWATMNNVEKSQLKDGQYQASVVRRDTPEEIEDESPEVQLVPVSNVRD